MKTTTKLMAAGLEMLEGSAQEVQAAQDAARGVICQKQMERNSEYAETWLQTRAAMLRLVA